MNSRFPKLLLAASIVVPSLSADPLGFDWGRKISDQTNALITAKGGVLVQMGLRELLWIGVALILFALIRWARAIVDSANGFHTPIQITEIIVILAQIWLASFALNHYMVPIGGTSTSLHQIPMQISESVVTVLDRDTIDTFQDYVHKAIDGTEVPKGLDLIGVVTYCMVMVVLFLLTLVMFVTTSFGYIGNAIYTVIGPLFIPLALTKHFYSWFWNWLQGMFAFAAYRAMATIIGYLCSNVLIYFFVSSMGEHYSIASWGAMLPVVVMLTALFVFSAFLIPLLCASLFNGAGAIGQAAVLATGSAARGAISAARGAKS